MSFQIKIENLSPDVGVVEVTQDDGVLHTLTAGQFVTINVNDVSGLRIHEKQVEAGEETVVGETEEETTEEESEDTTAGGASE